MLPLFSAFSNGFDASPLELVKGIITVLEINARLIAGHQIQSREGPYRFTLITEWVPREFTPFLADL